MTLSVHVAVPGGVPWTGEVVVIEHGRDGRPSHVHPHTLGAGEDRMFHAHDGAFLVVSEGGPRAVGPGAAGIAVFAFGLGQPVTLIGSAEAGTVIGRYDHAESARSYLVRYRAADGCLTESWWAESAIAAAPSPAPAAPQA